jgi:hypothetical protein
MNKNLIPDLENIVGDYTEEKEYVKLIELNPNTHNLPKLKAKIVENVPIIHLSIISAAYKAASEWCEGDLDCVESNGIILGIVPTFIQLVRLFGKDYNFKKDGKKYLITIWGKDRRLSILDIVSEGIYINTDNMCLGDATLTKMLSKEQKKTIFDCLDIKGWDDESIDQFNDNVSTAVRILMDQDCDFHPMTNMHEYRGKLIDMVMKNYS